jgi:hypothetical protein
MNIHYGAIRRQPWMGKNCRWVFTANDGITLSFYHKPSKAEIAHECRGRQNADVFRVLDVKDTLRKETT